MATAYTIKQVTQGAGPVIEQRISRHDRDIFIRKITLNFDAIATATGVALATNDTFQAFALQAGELVLQAGIAVKTAATSAATGSLGFTTDAATHFATTQALNDIDFPSDTRTSDTPPIYLNTADTLDLLVESASAAGGEVVIWALIARI
jgi:hypothetical protein